MTKRKLAAAARNPQKKQTKDLTNDSFFAGYDSADSGKLSEDEEVDGNEETADEKRLRLAKQYLTKLELDQENIQSVLLTH